MSVATYAFAETIPADRPWLTPGKRYEVKPEDGPLFVVIDDEGDEIPCRWTDCAHLEGGSWRRDEEIA